MIKFRSGQVLLLAFVGLLLPHCVKAQAPPPSSLPPSKTVFLLLFENQNWASITPSVAPYISNTLLPMGGHATQYFNPPGLHPSEPNYIWLEAGNNMGLTTDSDPSASNSISDTNHLVTLLNNAGISWKAYEENKPAGCPLVSAGEYAAKHNPFVFFQDVTGNNDPNNAYCEAHIVDYSNLASDLSNGNVAAYNFITPNLCDDMHDCSIQTGDTWLANNLPTILNSNAFKNGGAIFIAWDEGEGGDGPIGMIVLSPLAKTNYSNAIHYTHSSTLRTMQEIFNVGPLLRDAANATDLSDFFAAGVSKPAPATSLTVVVH